MAYKLIERCVKKARRDDVEWSYDPETKKFAINLFFYSAKAYSYVRNVFHDSLPSVQTIKNWISKIITSPGFCDRSLFLLKMKKEELSAQSDRKLVVSIILDEMHLKKHIHFDGKQFIGGVDLGEQNRTENEDTAEIKEASEVLVFMVNAVNMKFRIPVGYFFINGLSATKKTELLRTCIEKIKDLGIEISNVTFDGPAAHLSMANQLGAVIKPDDPDPRIGKSFDLPYLVVLFDPPHMIKLVRNALASLKCLCLGSGKISWHFFEELYKLQYETGLHLANKLTKGHVDWQSKKMKVSYATQVFSQSVATALDYCRDVLKLPQFKGSEETAEFCRKMDRIFNVMNSSKKFENHDFKSAITSENKEEWLRLFDETSTYIRSLKTPQGTRIIDDRKKTGFVGLLSNMEAIKLLYLNLIDSNVLNFLPTRKLNQDPLGMSIFHCTYL